MLIDYTSKLERYPPRTYLTRRAGIGWKRVKNVIEREEDLHSSIRVPSSLMRYRPKLWLSEIAAAPSGLGAPVLTLSPFANRAGRSELLSSKRPVVPRTKLTTALPGPLSAATCTTLLGPEGDAVSPDGASDTSRPVNTPTDPVDVTACQKTGSCNIDAIWKWREGGGRRNECERAA